MRDSGRAAGDEALGPVLNVKVFDYQLNIDGVEAITHTLATGPVNDLELALFPDEQGGLSIEIRQRAALRRGDAEGARGAPERNADAVCRQSDLRCGDVETVSEQEYARLARINDTGLALPSTTLADLVAEQASKTPDAPRWRMPILN